MLAFCAPCGEDESSSVLIPFEEEDDGDSERTIYAA
jgi:hypothetical protein